MKYELKSISLWTFIKVAFVVNLLAGALAGFFVMPFFGMIMLSLDTAGYSDPGMYDTEEGAFGAMVILLPILFGLGAAVIGTMIQSVAVVIYNLMARLLGGFELNLQAADGNVTPVQASGSPTQTYQPPPRPNMPPPPRPTPTPPSGSKPSSSNQTEINE